ncbi:MAG: hypothetical protein PHG05_03820 [Candidatus Nanoarchaeia archaeon]|nr:hypothetical protein [Candidatus Nanoarchaeia archaeon]
MADLDYFLSIWESQGVFKVLMPFILVFAAVFAILQTTKLLGGKKNLDLIISLVVGAFFVSNQTLIEKLNNFLPTVALLVMGGLLFIVFFSLFSKENKISAFWFGVIFIVIIAVFALALGSDNTLFSEKFFYSIDWTWVAIIGIFIGVIIFFTRSKK